jgi:ATP-binding cassette subfamily C (CFTR/MRP) protein 1
LFAWQAVLLLYGASFLKRVFSSAAGVVVYDNVWMKYAPEAPYALKEVSFAIQAGEKVGVVGRTGSGKSTLLLALYRMFNLDLGRILIDNVDIASLTLLKLRRSLSIIPQVWGPPDT